MGIDSQISIQDDKTLGGGGSSSNNAESYKYYKGDNIFEVIDKIYCYNFNNRFSIDEKYFTTGQFNYLNNKTFIPIKYITPLQLNSKLSETDKNFNNFDFARYRFLGRNSNKLNNPVLFQDVYSFNDCLTVGTSLANLAYYQVKKVVEEEGDFGFPSSMKKVFDDYCESTSLDRLAFTEKTFSSSGGSIAYYYLGGIKMVINSDSIDFYTFKYLVGNSWGWNSRNSMKTITNSSDLKDLTLYKSYPKSYFYNGVIPNNLCVLLQEPGGGSGSNNISTQSAGGGASGGTILVQLKIQSGDIFLFFPGWGGDKIDRGEADSSTEYCDRIYYYDQTTYGYKGILISGYGKGGTSFLMKDETYFTAQYISNINTSGETSVLTNEYNNIWQIDRWDGIENTLYPCDNPSIADFTVKTVKTYVNGTLDLFDTSDTFKFTTNKHTQGSSVYDWRGSAGAGAPSMFCNGGNGSRDTAEAGRFGSGAGGKKGSADEGKAGGDGFIAIFY